MRKRKDLRVLRGKQCSVVIAGGGDGLFDAARELESWLAYRRAQGISEARPLFCHNSGAPVTVTQVRDEVKLLMQMAGRDPNRYGAHSLRIGGATAALAAGVNPQLIRLMGRWSSDVYEIYCRLSLQSALHVGRAIASAQVSALAMEGGFHGEALELLPSELGSMPVAGPGAVVLPPYSLRGLYVRSNMHASDSIIYAIIYACVHILV